MRIARPVQWRDRFCAGNRLRPAGAIPNLSVVRTECTAAEPETSEPVPQRREDEPPPYRCRRGHDGTGAAQLPEVAAQTLEPALFPAEPVLRRRWN